MLKFIVVGGVISILYYKVLKFALKRKKKDDIVLHIVFVAPRSVAAKDTSTASIHEIIH